MIEEIKKEINELDYASRSENENEIKYSVWSQDVFKILDKYDNEEWKLTEKVQFQRKSATHYQKLLHEYENLKYIEKMWEELFEWNNTEWVRLKMQEIEQKHKKEN